jgi:hypothetical protein
MIIKDLNGVRYRLSKNKLASLYASAHPAFYIYLSDVKRAELYPGSGQVLSAQLWLGNSGPGHYVRVRVEGNHIGCRDFSRDNMRLIKKAIKAAKQ